MEMTIAIYMVCESREILDTLFFMLRRDSFPDFSDEVDPRCRPLYDFLDGVEFPDVVRPVEGHGVIAIWFDSGETWQTMVQMFNQNLCPVERFLLIGSEPIDDDAEGMLYVRKGCSYDSFILAQEEGMKTPMDFREKYESEDLISALMQDLP